MSVFDLIVLAILAALTLRGIWKGMVSQIVSVASFFVCWIVATRFGSLVAPTIPVEAPWNQVLAMAVVFLITLVALRFATAALEKLIKHWHLAKLNTLLGGALGFVKGLLICMIITFFAVMFSEASRIVVFNSVTGNSLVRLITQIGVFVPRDSYEFIHTQLAQFQNHIDQAVPGQTPETVPVQSSETAQKMYAQLQQTKEGTETVARTGSLLSALSKWWSGAKDSTEESTAETVNPIVQAETYTPPAPPTQPIHTYTALSQPATTKPAAVEEFIFGQMEPSPSPTMQPLTAIAEQQASPSLAAMTPLTELSPIPSELEVQLLPTQQTPRHVGSDQLLYNSTQSTNPSNSARLFRSR